MLYLWFRFFSFAGGTCNTRCQPCTTGDRRPDIFCVITMKEIKNFDHCSVLLLCNMRSYECTSKCKRQKRKVRERRNTLPLKVVAFKRLFFLTLSIFATATQFPLFLTMLLAPLYSATAQNEGKNNFNSTYSLHRSPRNNIDENKRERDHYNQCRIYMGWGAFGKHAHM